MNNWFMTDLGEEFDVSHDGLLNGIQCTCEE